MSQNDKTSGAGTPKVLEYVVVDAIDSSRDTNSSLHLQARCNSSRFYVSSRPAFVVGGLVYGWRRCK